MDKNPDKTHSVDPQLPEERHLLESFVAKDPIAWPNASSKDWDTLDEAVYSRLLGVTSIESKVKVLEETIYHQASLLFGFRSSSNGKFTGSNRRSHNSISLIILKNQLISQLQSIQVDNRESVLSDLEDIRSKLRALRRSEKKRKLGWKKKKLRASFRRNPYSTGKEVLNLKSGVKLVASKVELDSHKSQVLDDPLFNARLVDLADLPQLPALVWKSLIKRVSNTKIF